MEVIQMKKAIILTCLAMLAAAMYFASPDEDKGKAEMERLGAKLQFGEGKMAGKVVGVDLSNTQVTDGDLRYLLHFKDLQQLDLRQTKVGDPGTQYLGFLKDLVTLNMFKTNLGDAGLARLKNLKDLETLMIGGTKVTDGGLKSLERLSR